MTGEPLIDVHAHFMHEDCGRTDWQVVNAARMRAGERIGVSCHVASILGSWGFTSPTYMPSPPDIERGNAAMFTLQKLEAHRVRSYVMVNPNDRPESLRQIEIGAGMGAVGLKLAASRRADDVLLDEVVAKAGALGWPVLHHIWQHRRRDWPSQEASDATELKLLAERHPQVNFILAHIGGGGDYVHTFDTVSDSPNIFLDLSGSGVDRGMLDLAVRAVGSERILWGSDLTMETGLAKLWALPYAGVNAEGLANIRWKNALRIFPPGSFPMIAERGH